VVALVGVFDQHGERFAVEALLAVGRAGARGLRRPR